MDPHLSKLVLKERWQRELERLHSVVLSHLGRKVLVVSRGLGQHDHEERLRALAELCRARADQLRPAVLSL